MLLFIYRHSLYPTAVPIGVLDVYAYALYTTLDKCDGRNDARDIIRVQ